MDGRPRGTSAAARAAELAAHYARILGPQADPRVSAVIRTCLRRLAPRLPILGRDRHDVEALIERVLRLGEVGSPDLVGSPRQIDADIARRLGESADDPRRVYRALRAMLGRTALVQRHSRQTWALRLSGLSDTSSEVHRALVAETPALYCLPTPAAGPTESKADDNADTRPTIESQHCPPLGASPAPELLAELARIRGELTVERLARAEADKRRQAADAELGLLRRALEEERETRIPNRHEQVDALQATVHSLEQQLAVSRHRELEFADALAEARRELDGVHQAQTADAAKVRELIESNRIPEAATYFAARMLDLNLEESAHALLTLVQATAVEDGPASSGESTPGVAASVPSKTSAIPGVADPQPQSTAAAVGHMPATAETTEQRPPLRRSPRTERSLTSQAPILAAVGVDRDQRRPEPDQSSTKVGRNAPCPCGSGKKFKRCCGHLVG